MPSSASVASSGRKGRRLGRRHPDRLEPLAGDKRHQARGVPEEAIDLAPMVSVMVGAAPL